MDFQTDARGAVHHHPLPISAAENRRRVLGSIARPWGFSAGKVDQVAETVFAVASMTSGHRL